MVVRVVFRTVEQDENFGKFGVFVGYENPVVLGGFGFRTEIRDGLLHGFQNGVRNAGIGCGYLDVFLSGHFKSFKKNKAATNDDTS